ncbi:hypothetical protein pb186bvf_006771 [Paramecium bursaria]
MADVKQDEFYLEQQSLVLQLQQSINSTSPTSNHRSIINENRQRHKILTQKSLLDLGQTNPIKQRKSSNSLCEPTAIKNNDQDNFSLIPADGVFTIYWFNELLQKTYHIEILCSGSIIMKELIQLSVKEFQQKYIELTSGFDAYDIEIYYAKKKTGLPKEDYSKFDKNIKVSLTGVNQFAFKLVPKEEVKIEDKNNKNQKWWNIFLCICED